MPANDRADFLCIAVLIPVLECSCCGKHYSPKGRKGGKLYGAESGRPGVLGPLQMMELRQLREKDVSVAECAKLFNVSDVTVCRVLRGLRAKLGPEKLKRPRSRRPPVPM